MQCPKCSAGVEPDERFCRACGTPLSSVTDGSVEMGATLDPPAKTPEAPAAAPPPPPPPSGAPLPPPQPTGPAAAPASQAPPVITPADDSGPIGLDELANPPVEAVATVQLVSQPGSAPVGFGQDPAPTTQLNIVPAAEPYGTRTDEIPALFDGSDDVADLPPARDPFKIRLSLVFGIFGLVAVVMVSVADLLDIFTSVPVDGIAQGTTVLEDVGTNLAVASFIGAGAMVLGGVLACFGLRWGAGLAGGAGLALAGWSAVVIGLLEPAIEQAVVITRTPTTPEAFTLTVTRDLGYWLIVAVGGIGFLTFLASLSQAGRGGRRSLNPWVAALAAVAPLVLAAGPMIPVAGASFADNFGTDGPLPPLIYFIGRLVQVGLVALIGAMGFLLVRNWGLGLAAGSVSVALWMWISSLGEFGDNPIGLAHRNLDAPDTVPHGVTTVGAGFTLVMLIIAVAVAAAQPRRPRR